MVPVLVCALWDKEYDRQWHCCNWQHRTSWHVLQNDPYSSLLQGMQSGVGWDGCLSTSWKRPKVFAGYLNTSLPERWDPTWSWHSIHTSADLETCGPVIQTEGGKRNGVIGRQMVWQMEQLNWINNRRLSRSKSLAHSAHIFPKSRWNKPWEQKFALISKFIFQ